MVEVALHRAEQRGEHGGVRAARAGVQAGVNVGNLRCHEIAHRGEVPFDLPALVALHTPERGRGHALQLVAGTDQQSMERDYVRLRNIEARYRILFDTSSDPVMVVDATTQKVIEANVVALALFKDQSKRLLNRDLLECFDAQSQDDVQLLLRMAHATARIEVCRVKVAHSLLEKTLTVTVFRQEGGAQFLAEG